MQWRKVTTTEYCTDSWRQTSNDFLYSRVFTSGGSAGKVKVQTSLSDFATPDLLATCEGCGGCQRLALLHIPAAT